LPKYIFLVIIYALSTIFGDASESLWYDKI
jgi:hypothetical protein